MGGTSSSEASPANTPHVAKSSEDPNAGDFSIHYEGSGLADVMKTNNEAALQVRFIIWV